MISIIVPVYNRIEVIEECVHSLQQQAYKDIEILLSDDGSDDGSRKILLDLAREDKRIRVLLGRHQGAAAARNAALIQAKGSYIGFLDSDDVIAPNTLKRLLDDIESTDADMACCRFRIEDITDTEFSSEEGCVTVKEPWEAFEMMLVNDGIRGYGVSPGTKLIRRDIIMRPSLVLFPEGVVFGEDTMWIASILERCNRVAMDNSVMMRYSYGCSNSVCLNIDTVSRLKHTKWKMKCLNEHGCSREAYDVMKSEERALIMNMLLRKN